MSLAKARDLLVSRAKGKRPKGARSVQYNESTADPREITFALNYLNAFGYLAKELAQWKDVDLDDLVNGIKKFQNFFGLAKDGSLCAKTIKAMEAPRCGMPDFAPAHMTNARAVKAWAEARLPGWQKRSLQYAITDYVPGILPQTIQQILQSAFNAWTQYGNIEVQPSSTSHADIIIATGAGPRSNFDGPGGTLAWAYLPNGSDGQLSMKFDLGETWVTGANQRGILLFNVACHEFGHLFGLDHSREQSALMAPYYNALIAVPQLNDDIPRFQARYGVKGPVVPPVQPPVQPPVTPPAMRRIIVDLAAGSKLSLDGQVLV